MTTRACITNSVELSKIFIGRASLFVLLYYLVLLSYILKDLLVSSLHLFVVCSFLLDQMHLRAIYS